MCVSCKRKFLMEYPYEFRCLIYNTKVIKQKRELPKMQRKQQAKLSNRFNYAELKISLICMDVMQINRESTLKLIATTFLILKTSKLNFNIIFKKKL